MLDHIHIYFLQGMEWVKTHDGICGMPMVFGLGLGRLIGMNVNFADCG